jgi:hypothetical protein
MLFNLYNKPVDVNLVLVFIDKEREAQSLRNVIKITQLVKWWS